jgi:NAD(P)H-quinone oxidoreductase subunit 5
MHPLIPWLLVLIPVLPLIAGLLARPLPAAAATRLVVTAAAGSLGLALLAGLGLALDGPLTARWSAFGAGSAFSLSLRLDVVSAVMVLLVAFLGLSVLRFARPYLAGDPHQSRFFSWMSLTLASVLTLVLSGNLLLILAAWITTSLSLHRLLLHYPDRAGAIFSARKKFVVSRLGDLCLAAALVLVYRAYGTWDLDALFAAASEGNTAALPATGFLLAACAALKSAQFPFHSWLPDTMETPTPVSAFMHAGIINAGGFLIVRLSPLFVHAPGALNALAFLGTLTAAFGAIVMLAQPSVKRALAYSTIAQMGFMMLQCGLGAFGLALLHIVAHALYKAHAFLHAGSTIGAVPRAAIPLKTPALALGLLGGGLVVAGGATALHVLAPAWNLHLGVFALVLALALAYGLARAASAGGGLRTTARGTAVAAAIGLASLVLHAGSAALFAELPAVTPSPALLALAAAVFIALFFFQALLWRAGHHPLGRRLYVHALNGFYVGTYANRLLGWLWPRHPVTAA